MNKNTYKILFGISFLISVLVLFVSGMGLSSGHLYAKETLAWQVQCYGQDMIDLTLVAPALVIAALLMLNGHLLGRLVWPGLMLYLIYTFAIYCFDVHFNSFFIEYCLIFGLSIYSLIYFFYRGVHSEQNLVNYSSPLNSALAIYCLLMGTLFYFLWLSEIIPAIRQFTEPKSLTGLNLPTNPVHVLDLALLLPLFIITGVLLLQKRPVGTILAAYLLVFSIVMDITIGVLNFLMKENFIITLVFAVLTLISTVFLAALIKQQYALQKAVQK